MTILTPSWNQNSGAVNTALMMRYYAGALLPGSGTLFPRGGINYTMGGGCAVTEDSPASMNVRVASGVGASPGSESGLQGAYPFVNDGTVVLAIGASHATLNRIDLVIVRVRDSAFSGVTNNVTLEVVAGTPNASPVAPAAPANSLILAQVLIGAAVTTITNSVITDRRWSLSDTLTIRKASDEVVNNSTTFQDDDHLRFPLNDPVSTRWAIDGFIFYDSSTTADIKLQMTIPTNAEWRGSFLGLGPAVTTGVGDMDSGGSFSTSAFNIGGRGIGTFNVIRIIGTATVSATGVPGSLVVQWAQATLDAVNTRITNNSWIRGTRL